MFQFPQMKNIKYVTINMHLVNRHYIVVGIITKKEIYCSNFLLIIYFTYTCNIIRTDNYNNNIDTPKLE